MGFNNQRKAYGAALMDLGAEDPNVVVLDADLGNSTMSRQFQDKYPERYFEMGIAEADMTSTAAGLAAGGKIPFTNSFAVFSAGRAFDQIRQTIAIGKLNVKICGSSAGMSDFGDGATHQAVEDIAIMRATPNMTVLSPADGNEAYKAVRAMAAVDGPCYIRVNRNDYVPVTGEGTPFVIGQPTVLREGRDVTVFATGYMVSLALQAAEQIKDKTDVKVVNVSTIKPINEEKIQQLAEGSRGVVTVEEHSVIGGLGSAVAQALAPTSIPISFVGIEDCFGCSAHGYGELLEYFGLTTGHIVEEILKFKY